MGPFAGFLFVLARAGVSVQIVRYGAGMMEGVKGVLGAIEPGQGSVLLYLPDWVRVACW